MKSSPMLVALATLSACGSIDYEPMAFRAEGSNLVAEGTIDGTTLARFENAVAENPQADTLVLKLVDGSADDDANLIFARAVRAHGFTTIVPSDGMVASGGTDLFLAGKERILKQGACVGVHSWSDGARDGNELPRSAEEHRPYLSYYAEMGIPASFYWYTLEAANAEDMHWMTAAEARSFAMATQSIPALSAGPSCRER